jgi:hypothetical protein
MSCDLTIIMTRNEWGNVEGWFRVPGSEFRVLGFGFRLPADEAGIQGSGF